MKYLKAVPAIVCLSALPLLFSNANAREACQLLESDSDGDGWGWEAGASCRVTPDTGVVPVIVHPRTGESINIERIFWVWEDFNEQTYNECHGYVVAPDQSTDICSTCRGPAATYQHSANGVGQFTSSITLPAIAQPVAVAETETQGNDTEAGRVEQGDGVREQASREQDEARVDDREGLDQNEGTQESSDETTGATTGPVQRELTASFDWNVDNNGLYTGALDIEFYGERTANGVRFWQEGAAGQIGFYTFCEVIPSSMGSVASAPSGNVSAIPVTTACIDSDGDGWGWDGSQSCIP